MSGKRQKSAQQKKLEGTFRKDRDGDLEKVENEISKTAIKAGAPVKVPTDIKDKELKYYYQEHFQRLTSYGLLLPVDLVEFNQIFLLSQQLKDLQKELKKQDITTDNGLERYQHITYVMLKISARLSDLCQRYYISPASRAKLTLDELDIQKKSNENESVISKLINQSKAATNE